MSRYSGAERGFTLIEAAIVILIGGLMLAGASAILLSYIKETQLNTTRDRLEVVDNALQLFLELNGRYPCVAPANEPIDSPDFGREITDCSTAPAASGGRDGRVIRVGVVPVRTLSLPDDIIGDAWGSRLTYAVTEALAVDGTYNRTEGGIFVQDSVGNDIVYDPDDGPGTAHYVIISHGPNKVGGTTIQGTSGLACEPASLEGENCNGDAVFVDTLITSTAAGAGEYDDHVAFKATTAFGQQTPPGAVMAFDLSACPDGWVNFSDGAGRFLVGADGTSYTIGATGGSADITLANDEIGFEPSTVGINPAAVPGGVQFAEALAGSKASHENRPPFIALLLCKKS